MAVLNQCSRGPFISLLGASFRLGDRLIFERTNWRLRRNEQWAIVGENGGGKSLFADALRGRLPLVHGELRYHFRPPAGLSAEESIALVSFEDRKREVHDTVVQSRWNSIEEEASLAVRDSLSYERVMDINPFEVTDRHEQQRRLFETRRRAAVRLLRIQPFLDRTLLSLSNGETQRVQLARALCHPLRLLILDEPFQGLDAEMRRHFLSILESLMRRPMRVLLLTTRAEDLPRHITHVALVDHFRIVADGARAALMQAPRVQHLIAKSVKPSLRPATPRRRSSESSSPPGIELVRLSNVTVRYGDSVILDGIDWTIRAGESWALLGPNGSGKTTLLSLILGDNPQAYNNDVVVFGRRRGTGESIWDLRRRIGWVSPELHVHFNEAATCLDVVASGFAGTIGLSEPATRAQKLAARKSLDRFGLLDCAEVPLFALSVGLQRMVLLARALVKRAGLLILDEPCQGLDLAHRRRFIQAVDSLLRAGSITAIYVTHRPDELPPSIRRILRLRKGKVVAHPDAASRSADFQSAVSPISNRQRQRFPTR